MAKTSKSLTCRLKYSEVTTQIWVIVIGSMLCVLPIFLAATAGMDEKTTLFVILLSEFAVMGGLVFVLLRWVKVSVVAHLEEDKIRIEGLKKSPMYNNRTEYLAFSQLTNAASDSERAGPYILLKALQPKRSVVLAPGSSNPDAYQKWEKALYRKLDSFNQNQEGRQQVTNKPVYNSKKFRVFGYGVGIAMVVFPLLYLAAGLTFDEEAVQRFAFLYVVGIPLLIKIFYTKKKKN